MVNGKGKQQGEPFKRPEFFYAIASVWLRQQPTNWKLKDQLLGIQ
ncbi:MAG: chalcone isomerase family protein [Burkholderiales bacterium]|nr:chalcone isomerase family protein [Burkholderiales bacterium]